jgi:O-antigen ligase
MRKFFEWLNIGLLAASLCLIPFGGISNICFGLLGIQGLILLIQKRRTIFTDPVQRYFLLFFLLYWIPIGISLIDAVNFMKPFTHIFLGHLPYYFAGLFCIEFMQDEKRRRILTTLFFGCIALWCLDACIQLVFKVDMLGYPLSERVGGPFEKAANFGYYIGPLSSFLLFYAIVRNWNRWKGTALFIFTTLIVLLGNTRSGWIMYLPVSALFLYNFYLKNVTHRLLWILMGVTLGIALLFGSYKLSPNFKKRTDQTLQAFNGDLISLDRALSGRLSFWIAASRIIKDHPINGVGPRCYRYVADEYWPENDYLYSNFNAEGSFKAHPHCLYLEYAVGTGVIGIVGLLSQYGLAIWLWVKTDKNTRLYALPAAVALLALYFPIHTGRAHFATDHSLVCWLVIALYFGSLSAIRPDRSSNCQ